MARGDGAPGPDRAGPAGQRLSEQAEGSRGQSARSTIAALADSTKMMARSPGFSTSEPCGNSTVPLRITAPMSDLVAGNSLKRPVRQLRLGPHGDVHDLEAVALQHRDLPDAGIVREAHHLLGGDLPRVDGHVDAATLVDLRCGRVVHERDREAHAVELREHRGVEVLGVVVHGEDGGGPPDPLTLEEGGIERVRVEHARLRQLFRHGVRSIGP